MVTGKPLHLAKDPDEVVALEGEQLLERALRVLVVVGEDHLPHGGDALGIEEHVLGAAEPDAFGAEVARGARVERRVGVGPHPQLARGVGPLHELGELVAQRRGRRRNGAQVDAARSRRRA